VRSLLRPNNQMDQTQVVIDENLVSSRRPSDMQRFTGTINDWLRRNVKAPTMLARREDVFETNVFGVFRMIQAFTPLLAAGQSA